MSLTSSLGASPTPPAGSITSALSGLPGGQGLASAESDLMAGLGKKRELEQQESEEIGKARKQIGELKPPTLDELPDAPKMPEADPLKAFGSTATILAVLGGMLTRRSLTNSLNAAAGAMGALRQQDLDKYKQQYDEWKVNIDNAIKLQNFKVQAYEEAVSKISTDAHLAQVQLETAAHAFGDTTMVQLAQTNMDEAIKYKDAQARLSVELGNRADKLKGEHQKVTLLANLTDARKKLAIAQRTGDPEQIRQATDDVTSEQQKVVDWAALNMPGVMSSEIRGMVGDAGGVKDENAARQTYNTMFPVQQIGKNMGRRTDQEGNVAPDFNGWYRDNWPEIRGAEPAMGRGAGGATPAPTPGAGGGKSGADKADLVAKAKAAIAAGAPPDKVRARLKDLGVDPSALDAGGAPPVPMAQ